MSNHLIFYRKANVSSKEATDELLAAHPGHSVALEVELATTDTARHARAEVGELIYVATVKEAEGLEPEFGAADDGPPEDSAPEGPPEPAEAEGESEDKPEPKEEKSEESDEGEKSEKSDGPPKHDGEHEEHQMKPEEEMVHLLKKILEAVSTGDLGAPDKDPLGPPEPHGLGPEMPKHPAGPPMGGPPPGAGPGGPGLPPPVDKAPAGAAFASVRQASSFSVVREQANELGIRGIKAETESLFPTHRVAKIRTTGFATIDGADIYLPEARLAVIELTRR